MLFFLKIFCCNGWYSWQLGGLNDSLTFKSLQGSAILMMNLDLMLARLPRWLNLWDIYRTWAATLRQLVEMQWQKCWLHNEITMTKPNRNSCSFGSVALTSQVSLKLWTNWTLTIQRRRDVLDPMHVQHAIVYRFVDVSDASGASFQDLDFEEVWRFLDIYRRQSGHCGQWTVGYLATQELIRIRIFMRFWSGCWHARMTGPFVLSFWN